MFQQHITSSSFLFDAEQVKESILSATDVHTARIAESKFNAFLARYEPMEQDDEESYEFYNQTLTYLVQLLEGRQDSLRS